MGKVGCGVYESQAAQLCEEAAQLTSGEIIGCMAEADLYKEPLRQAKEHLSRWEKLMQESKRKDDPGWQCILAIRQAEVKQLELLIKMAGG